MDQQPGLDLDALEAQTASMSCSPSLRDSCASPAESQAQTPVRSHVPGRNRRKLPASKVSEIRRLLLHQSPPAKAVPAATVAEMRGVHPERHPLAMRPQGSSGAHLGTSGTSASSSTSDLHLTQEAYESFEPESATACSPPRAASKSAGRGRRASLGDRRKFSVSNSLSLLGMSESCLSGHGPDPSVPSPTIDPKKDTDRRLKIFLGLFYAAAMPVAYVVSAERIGVEQLCAYLIFSVFTGWTFMWIWLLCRAKVLFRVRVKTRRIKEWLPVSTPYARTVNLHKPVYSISELSAIRGTMMFLAMQLMSVVCPMLLCVGLVYDLELRDAGPWDVSDRPGRVNLLLCILMLGAPLQALFELNPFERRVNSALHYVGALFVFVGGFALPVQQEWSILSSSLTAFQCVSVVAMFASWKVYPTYSDDIFEVTRASKVYVGTELAVISTAIGQAALALAWTRYDHAGMGV